MKLLFDQNLSPRLVAAIDDLYPGSTHVRDLGLQAAGDDVVWERAAKEDFVLVSKDSDFHQRSFLYGSPPKVVWIRLGNCKTADIEAVLRARHHDIVAFVADTDAAFLALA